MQFKEERAFIIKQCELIGSTLLVDIEKNYVHDEGVFEAKQARHRQRIVGVFNKRCASISSVTSCDVALDSVLFCN